VLQSRISEEKLLRSKFGPEHVIVVGLRNFADQLINPMDSLFEHQFNTDDSMDDKEGELSFTAEVMVNK
jgi:hypothetical protein